MSLVRVDIETVVVGGGPVASLIVLKPRESSLPRTPSIDDASAHVEELSARDKAEVEHFQPLPIRLGVTEAAGIAMGVNNPQITRPMTHDLFHNVLRELGVKVTNVVISGVDGTTFFAKLNLACPDGRRIAMDARPSDAIALALREKAPVFCDSKVLKTASVPDFESVRREEVEREVAEFKAFLEDVSPDDFTPLN